MTTVKPEWYDYKLLEKNPANRTNIRRLSDRNKEGLLELITTPIKNRTPAQLKKAGIVRPDWSGCNFIYFWSKAAKENQKFYLSDEFIRIWLIKGYISTNDVKGLKNCRYCDEDWCHMCDDRAFVNMCCAVVDESDCVLQNCYLPYAKFDNMQFINAVIDNCVLDGATAYDSGFYNCCGGDAHKDLHFVKYLEKLGVEGIDFTLYEE